MHELIGALVDEGSFFEIGPLWGTDQVTGFARFNGHTVGILASDPRFLGGAMDADACSKATDFIVLCDSYNVPLVFLQDQPGFLIGPDSEKRGVIGRVINWMNALLQVTVPRISIILRKSYGRGFINMGGAGIADEIAAWWTAEVSFMNPRTAVMVVHGVKEEDDPERFQEARRVAQEELRQLGDRRSTAELILSVVCPDTASSYVEMYSASADSIGRRRTAESQRGRHVRSHRVARPGPREHRLGKGARDARRPAGLCHRRRRFRRRRRLARPAQ